MSKLVPASWSEYPADVVNRAGYPLYEECELNWSRPTAWTMDMQEPECEKDSPFVYALIRNHHNAKSKDKILYIGLTASPSTRFGNHQAAKRIVSRQGRVSFSYAKIKYVGRNSAARTKRALEEIEHLLIWAMDPYELENERKIFTLPGMGSNGGNAWHILNSGYRFSGRMPREIVFPAMLVAHGRNNFTRS